MKFCTNCGNKLDDDAQFCTSCGTPQPTLNGNDGDTTPPITSSKTGMSGSAVQGATPHIPLPGNNKHTSTSTSGQASPQPVSAATPAKPMTIPAQPTDTTTTLPAQSTSAFAGQAFPPTNSAAPAFIPHADTDSNAGAAVTTAAQTHTKRRLIIIIAAIVAVILVVAGAGFCTYKAQLWGGKTVPKPTDLGIAKSSKIHEFTAADVEKSLHKRGFKTVTKQTFSAKPKGSFLGYNNVQLNTRYRASDPVAISASLGPGVPKGTSGQSVDKIQKSITEMNVPVHYHKVVVTDQKTAPNTVVASYPADGQPVTDTKTGINIGVAEQGKGVGYDIVGLDKDQAKQQYASAGFNVTMKPRFSSKAHLGKIVDSNPKPGSEANGGNLTLYYGIDASEMKDAVSAATVYGPNSNEMWGEDPSGEGVVGAAAPVAGTYCTKAGKCITLNEKDSSSGDPDISSSEPAEAPAPPNDQLIFCAAMQQAFCGPKKGILYGSGAGAFELLPRDIAFGFTCGKTNEINSGSAPAVCVNGNPNVDVDYDNAPPLSGASYQMGTLYTYFPVGSDVSKVIDSGYFDKASVSEAKKQQKIDTSRPFFIRRDKSLYDKTSVDITDMNDPNPFTPSLFPRNPDKPSLEPVKPAPSDETAYYLVDDPQLDWASLPEFAISKDGSKADPKPTAKNATPDQITTATQRGDFSTIAGKYCTNGGNAWK